jgi:transposase
MQMFPASFKDLIPEDDPVLFISETIDGLDLTVFYNRYRAEGHPAYHPLMMIKLLIYAYFRGVRSSRKIADLVANDIRFMYLAARQKPDFRTISDFRKRHLPEFLQLFVQIVQMCQGLGLVGMRHWAVDGTKIEANAGWKHGYTHEGLNDQSRIIERKIAAILDEAEEIDRREDEEFGADRRGDELPEELRDARRRKEKIDEAIKHIAKQETKHTNLTDPDARVMQHYGGKRDWSYNAQVAVDDQHQIIVSSDVSSDITDHHQLIPMYEQAVENTGQRPQELSADSGYHTRIGYQYLEENEIDAYLPDQNQEADRARSGDPFASDQFKYDDSGDYFTCPRGQRLVFVHAKQARGVMTWDYRCQHCPSCPDQNRCVKRGKHRYIVRSQTDAYQRAMRAKLDSPEGRKKYQRRMSTVEPTIGQLKRNFGFTYFLLRSLPGVRGEFHLLTAAFNLKKIWLHGLKGASTGLVGATM